MKKDDILLRYMVVGNVNHLHCVLNYLVAWKVSGWVAR